MALDRLVHAPEAADGTTAPAVAAPVALGSAVHGGLAQMFTPPILGVSHDHVPASCAAPAVPCRTRSPDPRRCPDGPRPEPGGDPHRGRHREQPPGQAHPPTSRPRRSTIRSPSPGRPQRTRRSPTTPSFAATGTRTHRRSSTLSRGTPVPRPATPTARYRRRAGTTTE